MISFYFRQGRGEPISEFPSMADSVYNFQSPSPKTRNHMDWKLLVKERNDKKVNCYKPISLEGWFSKTKSSVLVNQPTLHSGGFSSGRVRACGCWHCCGCGSACDGGCGLYWFPCNYLHMLRGLKVSRRQNIFWQGGKRGRGSSLHILIFLTKFVWENKKKKKIKRLILN